MSQLAQKWPVSWLRSDQPAAQAVHYTTPGALFMWTLLAETGRWLESRNAVALVCHDDLCVSFCFSTSVLASRWRLLCRAAQLVIKSFRSTCLNPSTCVIKADHPLLFIHCGTWFHSSSTMQVRFLPRRQHIHHLSAEWRGDGVVLCLKFFCENPFCFQIWLCSLKVFKHQFCNIISNKNVILFIFKNWGNTEKENK